MNEHESLNTEHTDTHEDEHICTDGSMCEAGDGDAMIASAEPTVHASNDFVAKKRILRRIILAAIAIVVVACIALGGFVYTHASSDKTVQAIARPIPFPAMMVGRSIVTYGQYYEEREALTKYFASQQAGAQKPTDDQFNQLVIDTLVNKTVVKTMAANYGIALDQGKVEVFYQNIVKSSPSEDAFKKQLQDTFGWSVAEFKRRIVEPVVLSQQVGDYVVANNALQQPKRDLIDQAHARVAGGEEFAKVATDVHTREQVTMNSDLGLMKIADLPAVWADQVKGLEKGKPSNVIDLPQGFAIFMVTDRVGTGAAEQLHLMAMTVPKVTLQTVVADYLKNVKVKTLIRV